MENDIDFWTEIRCIIGNNDKPLGMPLPCMKPNSIRRQEGL